MELSDETSSSIDEDDEYELLIKFLIIGDSSVGKSSILLRYIQNTFNYNNKATIGIDFVNKTITKDGKKIKLSI